jgi:hypothetical protein
MVVIYLRKIHDLLIAGDFCKKKTLNFLFFSKALALILLTPNASLNLLLKLHDMTEWIFHPSATLYTVSL